MKTRLYPDVQSMMIGEKWPKAIIKKVQTLLKRDEGIAHEFKEGKSITMLANKYNLTLLQMEDILRYEILKHET